MFFWFDPPWEGIIPKALPGWNFPGDLTLSGRELSPTGLSGRTLGDFLPETGPWQPAGSRATSAETGVPGSERPPAWWLGLWLTGRGASHGDAVRSRPSQVETRPLVMLLARAGPGKGAGAAQTGLRAQVGSSPGLSGLRRPRPHPRSGVPPNGWAYPSVEPGRSQWDRTPRGTGRPPEWSGPRCT